MSTDIATLVPGAENVVPTGRELALLRAVDAGRATISSGVEPDLFIDGVSCGDQFTAHLLVHRGLIRPEGSAPRGILRPARLTSAGQVVVTTAA